MAGDLTALGQVALTWATDSPRKAGKPRFWCPEPCSSPGPAPGRRRARPQARPSATALLEAAEGLSDQVPANTAAWERFVKQIREESADRVLRRSA